MVFHRVRRGTANTATVVIVVVVAVFGGLLVLGCLGAILGIMLPAVGKAQDAVLDVRSAAQLRQIEFAYSIWQRDPGSEAPFSFDALVAGDYATADLFDSPHGPVPDGGGDYWLLHPRPELDDPGDLIVGYDRAMYATRSTVAVVFGDGRTETLAIDDFEVLIAAPPNDQIRFDLPPRRQ